MEHICKNLELNLTSEWKNSGDLFEETGHLKSQWMNRGYMKLKDTR